MRRESKTQDIIHISREDWDTLNWKAKGILIGNVKIIEKDKEITENGGGKQDVDKD